MSVNFDLTKARTLKVRAFLFIAVFSSLVSAGCAQRLEDLDEKIADIQQRTSLLEAKTGGPVGNDRELLEGQKLADVRSQVSTIRNELTVVSGKIEALEYESKRISTRQDQMSQELEQRLKQLSKRADASEVAAAGDSNSGAVESDYELGLKAHQDGDFAKAEKHFETYISKNPRGSYSDRSLFWIGDGFMSGKLYKKAIAKFQDLIDRFPKSEKRCEAMAKQIQAFKALGMQKEAGVFTQVRESECK